MSKKPTKININCSWPVTLEIFENENTSEDEHFTRGKLNVFYKGETADHRFFSPTFSESLIKSLPYAPIVGFYDEENDDFVGHNTEQQIFGIVDPKIKPTFETDDQGNEWAVCGTVLYTSRPDKVGEIARKIEGHAQSLELDPETVEYKINYDDRKHFKNIEFTKGNIIGVSVLGTNQQPAFTGSHFFTAQDDVNALIEDKFRIFSAYLRKKNEQGGNKSIMANSNKDFVTLSWGEKGSKLSDALTSEYSKDAYTWIEDIYDDYIVADFYYKVEGVIKTFRIDYTMDDSGNVSFGNIIEVHKTYEPIESADPNGNMSEQGSIGEAYAEVITDPADHSTDPSENLENAEKKEEEDKRNCSEEDLKKEDDKNKCETEDLKKDDEENKGKCSSEDSDELSKKEEEKGKCSTEKVDNQNDEKFMKEENESSTSSLSTSEREELEKYRKKEKVDLINHYKDCLTNEEFDNFNKNVDSYDIKELKLELLEKFEASIVLKEENKTSFSRTVFNVQEPSKSKTHTEEMNDYVRSILERGN